MVVTSARQLSLGDALRQGSGLLDARVGEEQHLEPIVGVATISLVQLYAEAAAEFCAAGFGGR